MGMTAADIMKTQLVTGTRETRLYQALEMMGEKGIRHLPIVEDGKLLGILSDRDLQKHMSATFGSADEKSGDRLLMLKTAEELMTKAPITVRPDTALKEVVHILVERKFGAVPVVDEAGMAVGIITSIDLLRLLEKSIQ